MPVWQTEPIARLDDSRWLDHPVWKRVVVRAPTAAFARTVAAELKRDAAAPTTGNESHSFRSGLVDEKLYRVRRLSEMEVAQLPNDDDSEPRVLLSAILRAAPEA